MGIFSKSTNQPEPKKEESLDYLLSGWTSFQEGNIDLGIEKNEKFLSGISKDKDKIIYSTPDKVWFWEVNQQTIEIVTNNLAVMYKEKGNLDLAEHMWKTVSHLHYAQFNLAELARLRNNLTEAKKLYKSSASFGNYTGLAFNAYFLTKEGDVEGAKREINSIIEQNKVKELLEFISEAKHQNDQLYMQSGLVVSQILLENYPDSIVGLEEFIKLKQKIFLNKIDKNYEYSEAGNLKNLSMNLDITDKRSDALKELMKIGNEGNEMALEILQNDAIRRENLMEADHWASKRKEIQSKIGNNFHNLTTGLAAGTVSSVVANSNLPSFLTNLKGMNEYNKFKDRADENQNDDNLNDEFESDNDESGNFGNFFG